MKVAFISTILSYPWGGADTLWTHAAEAAQGRGDSLLIAVTPAVAGHPRVAALAARGARLAIRPPPPSPPGLLNRIRRRLPGWPRRPDPLVATLKDFRPDLVVCSCGGTYDLLLESPLCAWLRESRVAYRLVANFQTEHPSLPEAEASRIAGIFAEADALFFVSTRNLEITRRHLLLPLLQARVVHNPLRWRPEDASPWPGGREWRLATVSRLDHGKGIHLLLQAAAEVLHDEPDWRIDIFGRGPAEGFLRATVDRAGLADRVRLCGYEPNLGAIWRGHHLMVSPAIDDGVPMTIPEAMLCERPVLATAVGGAEDWLTHGRTGFICPAPTLPLLAGSLREAWAARSRWQAMGQAAAAQAKATYRRDEHGLLIQPVPTAG